MIEKQYTPKEIKTALQELGINAEIITEKENKITINSIPLWDMRETHKLLNQQSYAVLNCSMLDADDSLYAKIDNNMFTLFSTYISTACGIEPICTSDTKYNDLIVKLFYDIVNIEDDNDQAHMRFLITHFVKQLKDWGKIDTKYKLYIVQKLPNSQKIETKYILKGYE